MEWIGIDWKTVSQFFSGKKLFQIIPAQIKTLDFSKSNLAF